MKDYVYPTTDKGETAQNPLQPSINWSEVEARLAQASTAQPAATPDEVLDYLKLAGNADHLKDYQFKPKGEDAKTEDEPEDEDFVKHGKEASAQPRKIVFSSREQLSPEALQAALDAGDTDLYNTILAARHQQRVSVAAAAEANMAELAERNKTLTARSAYRARIVSAAKKAKDTAVVIAKKKAVAQAKPEVTVQDDFVAPDKLSASAKDAFLRKANKLGFPTGYAQAMLEAQEVKTEHPIFEVLASNLSIEAKKAAVTSMVRTAELSSEDEARLRKYWASDLGMPDEWVNDLVASYSKK